MLKSITSFDGLKISYNITKNEPETVIFLHGIGSNNTIWENEINILSKAGFSVVAPDLRGHGLSDKPHNKEAYFLENFARDINRIIKKEKLDKVTLVGYSFGGAVSIIYNQLFEEKVNSMVLVNTGYKIPITFYITNKLKFLRKGLYKSKLALDYFKKKKTDRIVLRHCISQMRNYERITKRPVQQILTNIKVPVLFIEGTADEVIPPKHMDSMCRFIKTAELHKIEGAHHNVWLEKPDEVNKYMLPFLEKYTASKIPQIAMYLLFGLFIGLLSTPELMKTFFTPGITGAVVADFELANFTPFAIVYFASKVILSVFACAVIHHHAKKK